MAITFHKDSTLGLGSFIQVLARGRPIGRIFHADSIYRFSTAADAKFSEAELQDENLERLEGKIRDKYRPGRA